MRQRLPLILTAAILLLALIYATVRGQANARLALEIETLDLARQRAQTLVSGIDPALLKTRPAPTPDLPGWLAANPLKKFQEKVENNQPTKTGITIRLRRMSPIEVSELFSQFTQVALRIPHLILSDPDGDGSWTVNLVLEVGGRP